METILFHQTAAFAVKIYLFFKLRWKRTYFLKNKNIAAFFYFIFLESMSYWKAFFYFRWTVFYYIPWVPLHTTKKTKMMIKLLVFCSYAK